MNKTSSIPTILITAGPTYEPIDAVRFIGNRSSGRMGIEIANAAHEAGWKVILALGPNTQTPPPPTPRMHLKRFESCADLESLLRQLWPASADVLLMAAAVADYRPMINEERPAKLKRSEGSLQLQLESTPDLVAACASRKMPDQRIIGFALEPVETLMRCAEEKLKRKNLDAIIANGLETMNAHDVEATLLRADGTSESPGRIPKNEFAKWVMVRIVNMVDRRASSC